MQWKYQAEDGETAKSRSAFREQKTAISSTAWQREQKYQSAVLNRGCKLSLMIEQRAPQHA